MLWTIEPGDESDVVSTEVPPLSNYLGQESNGVHTTLKFKLKLYYRSSQKSLIFTPILFWFTESFISLSAVITTVKMFDILDW